MKAIMIVMFVLFINVSASIINAVNTLDPLYYETIQPFSEQLGDVEKQKIATEKYLQNPGIADTTQLTFGDYFWGIVKFTIILGKGMLAVPWLLNQFGVTNLDIKVFISSITYLIYLFGVYQLISNRATKSMY